MITIDNDKCIGCGQCIQVCPFTVLKMGNDKKAYCTDKNCIKCMHCAAICPQGAITYENKKAVLEEVKEIPFECKNNIELLIKQRRSYRKFQNKKINREEISRIIDIASLAPSAKNQHPVKWIVIDDSAKLDKLMNIILDFCKEQNICTEIPEEYKNGNNPVLGENATVLIGYCEEDAINPASDTAIALTTIELMMQANKIGTCWGGYLMRFLNTIQTCRKLVELPENTTVYGTLLFGYPNQSDYRYIPKRLDKTNIGFI